MQASHKVTAAFDDPNLIGPAGLVPVMRLAEKAGLHALLGQHLSLSCPNADVKAAGVVAGMLAGADCIDDLDVLRHGGMGKVFTGVRAPSTLGTFLRSFTFGHVRQLDAVAARILAGLATVVPPVLAGATDPNGIAFVDVDDTIRQTHGYQKQGVAYGYSKVKGLNAQLATLSSPTCAPVIARHGQGPAAQGQRRIGARRGPAHR
jgi:hypothetical protein